MGKVNKQKSLIWIAIGLFVFFYPMLISIYVFLPLFIGAMSYMFVLGLEKEKTAYVLISIFFMMNIEVNLSLPTFLIIISTLLFYVLVYPSLTHFRKCRVCRPILSVLLLDLMYLASLFSYDFIFQTQSIVLDKILLYSLVVDMLIVVIL
ncbi:hypothetical protein [Sulfurovum sp.]|uniref:hypothetical protein n=1 Tax=Sulfurovum sp. TaxID=1969726 RepID=UPI002867C7FF|nr:hypothetical protein [Sulfurovum sp.]